jgi:hypothetical protein
VRKVKPHDAPCNAGLKETRPVGFVAEREESRQHLWWRFVADCAGLAHVARDVGRVFELTTLDSQKYTIARERVGHKLENEEISDLFLNVSRLI